MDNARRAKAFEKALGTYATGSPQEVLIDLLTDAQHWCNANGEDFDGALAIACRHYIHEHNDEQHDERRLTP
jgi:hypothetical protein